MPSISATGPRWPGGRRARVGFPLTRPRLPPARLCSSESATRAGQTTEVMSHWPLTAGSAGSGTYRPLPVRARSPACSPRWRWGIYRAEPRWCRVPWGRLEDELRASTGAVLPGFPWFEADSNFSTPALADLYGNGQTEIIEGGDSTAGLAEGVQYQNGGHVRVLSQTGGLVCEHNTNQVVQSSPAVGEFLSGPRSRYRRGNRPLLARGVQYGSVVGPELPLWAGLGHDP